MASIQKRGGTYRVRITRIGYPTLSHSFKTRREAEKWARKTEASIDDGDFKPREKTNDSAETTLFKTAAEHYAKTHSPLKKSHRSEARLVNRLIDRFGQKPVGEIDARQVAALRDEMIKLGRGGSTVGHYLNVISKIYQMLAEEWGLNVANPIRGVKRPPQNPPRLVRLSHEAKILLLEACAESNEPLMPSIVRLALETGMRRGEIMSLTWREIDLEKLRITIRTSKNGSSRVIPVSNATRSILSAVPKTNEPKLFPIGAEAMRKSYERAVKRAEKRWTDSTQNPFADLTFHDLRHEALSHLSDKGLNVIELSQFSGHKTLNMLARYTHPDHAAVLKKINNLIHNST